MWGAEGIRGKALWGTVEIGENTVGVVDDIWGNGKKAMGRADEIVDKTVEKADDGGKAIGAVDEIGG